MVKNFLIDMGLIEHILMGMMTVRLRGIEK